MEGGSGRSKRLCSTWPYKRHRNFIDGTIYDIGSGSFPFLAINKNDRILFFLFLIHPYFIILLFFHLQFINTIQFYDHSCYYSFSLSIYNLSYGDCIYFLSYYFCY